MLRKLFWITPCQMLKLSFSTFFSPFFIFFPVRDKAESTKSEIVIDVWVSCVLQWNGLLAVLYALVLQDILIAVKNRCHKNKVSEHPYIMPQSWKIPPFDFLNMPHGLNAN